MAKVWALNRLHCSMFSPVCAAGTALSFTPLFPFFDAGSTLSRYRDAMKPGREMPRAQVDHIVPAT